MYFVDKKKINAFETKHSGEFMNVITCSSVRTSVTETLLNSVHSNFYFKIKFIYLIVFKFFS